MGRKAIVLIVLMAFVITFSGCATVRKEQDLEIQRLKNQISALETQIQSRDEEINSLNDALGRVERLAASARPETAKMKLVPEIKSRPNIKQIQIALQNAGYAPGIIDGKMGRQTRDAVRAFQRANNLPVDGKVGKKTWNLLKEYLYKKVK